MKDAAAGGDTYEVVNPADGSRLGRVTECGRAEVDQRVASARAAFPAWAAVPRRERAKLLQAIASKIRAHADELATLETLNNGKTYRESSVDDLPEAADVFDYYAGWTDKFYGESVPVSDGFVNFTVRDPVGVCALIVPWNFPLLLAAWKIAPALAMGNTVVVKPAAFTPHSLLRLQEILRGVLPDGVLNVVTGGAEAGRLLTEHADVDKVSFTGSTEIGRAVVRGAATNLKRVSLELGGKSANVVFDDVPDLDAVIQRGFTAMFSHKGEKCSEPTRFILHEKIYARFVEKLVGLAEAVVCGDPFDPGTTQGPQCHEAHFKRVLDYIEIGKREGAKLLTGGQRDGTRGFFIRPTIFGDVTPAMRIAREEIFGPVLCLMPFRDEDEAVRLANDSMFGLAAGVYTHDAKRALRMARALDAGMVFVNHYGCYDFASPFGGVKQSGWGHEMASHSLHEYTKLKSIWMKS